LATKDNRIFGLDILRSVAIIIVVLGHCISLLSFSIPGYRYLSVVDGVDLFFVLSGFLVGSMIINTIAIKQSFSFFDLKCFLKRRWLRTLPNYFLFLLINIILIYFGLIKGELNKYLATYFVFFQNFYKPFDFLFWESWSLSVEEWFYLLFPLMIFLILSFTRKYKTAIVFTIILFLGFPLAYRIFISGMHSTGIYWDLYFRKLVLARLDCIGYGILGAYIFKYHEVFWKRSKNFFFILGLGLIFFLGLYPVEYNMFFFKTIYFSLFGFAILLLIPKLENLKKENIPFKPFAFISKISYSMYLCHIPLYQILYNNFNHSDTFSSVIVFILYWIFIILLSAFIYKFFERPFMKLRKRIS
jgi:peptidoglycan/LPS O-acetylase OafA/YrhL